MYTLGIDIGSAATKGVILRDGHEIVSSVKIASGAGTKGAEYVMAQLFQGSGLAREDIAAAVATGYGRNQFAGADRQISELSCHARGVSFLVPGARTIIDIGGQDAKTIKLSAKGRMAEFVMNEKCAAGTGRFLDVMANVLETTVDQLGDLDDQAVETLSISSTCTVFAESEVISHLSNGKRAPDIIRAIHQSVAKRTCGLARRLGVEPVVVMTGGVAQNRGVVRALEQELGDSITVPENPQIVGALGAAILAWESIQNEICSERL